VVTEWIKEKHIPGIGNLREDSPVFPFACGCGIDLRRKLRLREDRTAVQLDPLASATQAALGLFLLFAGRYEEAVSYLQRGVELEPQSIQANMRLGRVYSKLGRYDEALTQFHNVQELAPTADYGRARIARVYAATGRQREARQMLAGLRTAAYGRCFGIRDSWRLGGDIQRSEKSDCRTPGDRAAGL
jgi:predicted Zn-dependent protease